MVSIRGSFEYPDGLTPGQSKDGGLHQNLYDDEGSLAGHGRFIPGDEDSSTGPSSYFFVADECHCDSHSKAEKRWEFEEIVEALVILIRFVEWSAPRLKRWWNGQALPFVKSARGRLSRARKSDGPDEAGESVTLIDAEPSGNSKETGVVLEEDRVSMSGEEASARFAAALLAKLFSEEQLRVLRHARIDDEGALPRSGAVEKLTNQQIRENVRSALEANPSLLTKESLGELGKFLARIQAVGLMRSIGKRADRGSDSAD
ncbi:hypothetical protein [Streptomyces sp. NPDC088915]|uniref:hypothetical protein n=1 Tax=Streptomyces sp. NPDC088915 TaxID=3365912 RepID=UPI00380710C4